MKNYSPSHNSNRNNKLSGHHILHMMIDKKVQSKSVDAWIAFDPVLLYQAVMGISSSCVIIPQNIPYNPSLQQPVLKKLELEVQKINPQLIGEKETRKLTRVATAHFKKKELEKQKQLEEQKELAKKKRSKGIWK